MADKAADHQHMFDQEQFDLEQFDLEQTVTTVHLDNQEAIGHYIDRPAEQLVVTGYRRWLYAMVHKDAGYIDEAFRDYQSRLGQVAGREALRCLVRVLHQLGSDPLRPLNFLAPDCKRLCCDECMVLSLVSGIQHCDDMVQESSLNGLVGRLDCQNQPRRVSVLRLTGELALLLKASGFLLLPVPLTDLDSLVARASFAQYGGQYGGSYAKSRTLH